MVTIITWMLAFSQAFYIIGRNEMQMDSIEINEQSQYTTWQGALKYIWGLTFFMEFNMRNISKSS
jgi:hypothetical protein